MRIISIFCVLTLAWFIIGCDKAPETVQPPTPPTPTGHAAAPTQQHTAPADIDQQINIAKANVQADSAALLKVQKDCMKRMETNPKYLQAYQAHDVAAAQMKEAVRQGETSGDDFNAMVKTLNTSVQAMSDVRKQLLDSDPALLAARNKMTNDEAVLESDLKEKGVKIAATPTPSVGTPPPADSGDSVLFPQTFSNGGTYVPGSYQKDGTYVPPHYKQ